MKGRKRIPNRMRTASGRISRSRESKLQAGELAYRDFAVYFAANDDGLVKIGHSGLLDMRLESLRHHEGSPCRLYGVALVPTAKLARALEKRMHENFKAWRDRGEWFRISRRDVQQALRDCQKIGVRTRGCEEGWNDVRLECGLAPAQDSDTVGLVRG